MRHASPSSDALRKLHRLEVNVQPSFSVFPAGLMSMIVTAGLKALFRNERLSKRLVWMLSKGGF
jgi:hypothetical protein